LLLLISLYTFLFNNQAIKQLNLNNRIKPNLNACSGLSGK
jgi:hypothetical protein